MLFVAKENNILSSFFLSLLFDKMRWCLDKVNIDKFTKLEFNLNTLSLVEDVHSYVLIKLLRDDKKMEVLAD